MTSQPPPISLHAASIQRFVEGVLCQQDETAGWIAVATATPFICTELGVAPDTDILLSGTTIATHRHHVQTTPAVYAAVIRALIRDGLLLRDKIGRWSLVGEMENKLWNAGLKRVQRHNSASQADEIWLVSLRRMDLRNFKRKFGEPWKRAGEPENA